MTTEPKKCECGHARSFHGTDYDQECEECDCTCYHSAPPAPTVEVGEWEKGKDAFIVPTDDSSTRVARPCGGCGHHQTIAGALLKSKEWNSWYKYASENMLYDVDETLVIDAMSDGHFKSFIDFTLSTQREEMVSKLEGMKKTDCTYEGIRDPFGNHHCESCGYNAAITDIINSFKGRV